MTEFSLVPVEHEPDFRDASLVPVEHDPFQADSAIQQAQIQQAQAQLEKPPQQPARRTDQPNVGTRAIGDGSYGWLGGAGAGADPNLISDEGGAAPAPFGGHANPTPTESLVNRTRMGDQEAVINADPTGKNGFVVDEGLHKFVTTKRALAHYRTEGGAGTVFTTIDPFYAYDGTRYAIIDASPARPVTVTVGGDGTVTISRP